MDETISTYSPKQTSDNPLSDNPPRDTDIAIIGMACRFPEANSISAFWQNLCAGRESIRFFSDEELRAAGVPRHLIDHPNYVKAAAALDDIEGFDAAFFDISPHEAEIMDPQSRLFLECAWHGLEDANLAPENFSGPIGLFAGASLSSYLFSQLYPALLAQGDEQDAAEKLQMLMGNDKDFLATRVSYKLNLTGPSMTIQTACSTSLVAVHQACQSLLNGECDAALAGGVSLRVPHQAGYLYQPGMVFSPDGRCRAFDAKANGMMAGNGVGVVVLKRLADALAEGDQIHGVIRGSAINNDGADKVGYAAPSVSGQAGVIAEALAVAEVEPETISYIEAHGTGTELGDPIEFAALCQVFGSEADADFIAEKPIALGSVKTNFGHLDAAAGVAGLIKTVLALKHRQMPPSLNFETPNPALNIEDSPFRINTALTPWEKTALPRRAGVSSFGIGGTNVHVVLQEAPELASSPRPNPQAAHRPWRLLSFSAKSAAARTAMAHQLADFIEQSPEVDLAQLAYTLRVGRAPLNYRQTLICRDAAGAIEALRRGAAPLSQTGVCQASSPELIFMFPGQGAQYPGMAYELYTTQPVFAETVDQCAAILQPELGCDIRGMLFPDDRRFSVDADSGVLHQTQFTQPALFVVEYALSSLLISWDLQPQAMIGHSIGEYVAACVAGVMTLSDALKLIALRGRLIQALPPGSMLAVALPEADILPYVSDEIDLAAVNGANSCVLAGPKAAIAALDDELQQAQIVTHPLQTSHAFHSRMLEPALADFEAVLRSVRLNAPRIPFVSNVSGGWITAEQAADPQYWVRHLRQTVRFHRGLCELLDASGAAQTPKLLLELGPGRVLSQLVQRHPQRAAWYQPVQTLPGAQQAGNDLAWLLAAVGRIWLADAGLQLDPRRFNSLADALGGEKCPKLSLPLYPFQHQRYWVEAPASTAANKTPDEKHFRNAPESWCYVPAWQRSTALGGKFNVTAEAAGTHWLVLVDAASEQQRQWVEALQSLAQQQNAVLISVAKTSNAALADYAIRPAQTEDYVELLATLKKKNQAPTHVFHLWGLRGLQDANPDQTTFADCQQHGFYSLLALAKALGRQSAEPVRISVVTRNLFDVLGDEALFVDNATALGPIKVIPQEYPHLRCQHIDLDSDLLQHFCAKDLCQQLVTDLLTNDAPALAYRGRYQWQPVMSEWPLERPEHSQPALKHKGVYVIIGGFGNIGSAIGLSLAKTAAREGYDIVLVILSRAGEQACEQRARHLQALQALGAKVISHAVDVTDAERLTSTLQQVSQTIGAISGVFHTAGERIIVGIESLQPVDCARQFAGKVQGVAALESAITAVSREQQQPLDFCVLISSLSSQLGGLGLAAYTAAHCYLDAWVARYHQRHPAAPWLLINWDNWLSEDGSDQVMAGVDIAEGLTAAQATALLDKLLSLHSEQPLRQICVSPTDLNARIARWVNLDFLGGATTEGAATEATGSSLGQTNKALHPRPALSTPYHPPQSAEQKTLAQLWQQLLGVSEIGIDDSFFELGGDSVVSIRFLAKAAEAGIYLTTQAMFEQQTIANLCRVAQYGKQSRVKAEQGTVEGQMPLTPIQHWFFERAIENRSHFNQVVLYRVPENLSLKALNQSLAALIKHHDALRLRFSQDGGCWQSRIEGLTADHAVPEVRQIEMALNGGTLEAALNTAVQQAQQDIDIYSGPLVAMAFITITGEAAAQPLANHYLAFAVHHLAVDGFSWRILHEDLQTCYRQALNHQPLTLPAKTTSWLAWSQTLAKLARETDFRQEADYWLTEAFTNSHERPDSHERINSHELPKDFPDGLNTAASAEKITFQLTSEQTHSLQHSIVQAFDVRMMDVLIAALYQAVITWRGREGHHKPSLRIDLEGHGRDCGDASVDVSRTVGWFTNLYPVCISSHHSGQASAELLKDIAAQLRRTPEQGAHYGLLRYLGGGSGGNETGNKIKEKLKSQTQSEILFLYLGSLEGEGLDDRQTQAGAPLFEPVAGTGGLSQSADSLRSHALEVNGWVQNGCLSCEFVYSKNIYQPETINQLIEAFKTNLVALISSNPAASQTQSRVAVFPESGLDQDDLAELLAEFGED